MLTLTFLMLHPRTERDMTQKSRHSLRGKCGFRSRGRGGTFLPSKLGSGNTTCSLQAWQARFPPASLDLRSRLTALELWDTLTTQHPPDQDLIPGPLLMLSRGKKTSSLQIHSLRLHRAIHLEVQLAMSHLERIILSLRGLCLLKLPSFLVRETRLEPALHRLNQKCLQKQGNFSVMRITMRRKTHLHKP